MRGWLAVLGLCLVVGGWWLFRDSAATESSAKTRHSESSVEQPEHADSSRSTPAGTFPPPSRKGKPDGSDETTVTATRETAGNSSGPMDAAASNNTSEKSLDELPLSEFLDRQGAKVGRERTREIILEVFAREKANGRVDEQETERVNAALETSYRAGEITEEEWAHIEEVVCTESLCRVLLRPAEDFHTDIRPVVQKIAREFHRINPDYFRMNGYTPESEGSRYLVYRDALRERFRGPPSTWPN